MKVGIIGAGIVGLTLAHRLSQAGYDVEILEAQAQPGGLSTWCDYGDFTWDKFYHVILKQDQTLLALIEELGLQNRMRWTNTRTGFLWKKRLVSMSNYGEFLRFPLLNFFQKIRFACGIFYACRMTTPETLRDKTAREWLISLFGETTFYSIWEPLVTSKYGTLKNQVPALQLWATLRRYYGTRTKSEGKEWMGYLSGGGLKVLIDALVERLKQKQGLIHYQQRVQGLTVVSDEVHVKTSDHTYRYDYLLSTTPTWLLDQWMPSDVIQSKPSTFFRLGVIRLALVLKSSFSPFYVTNLIDKDLPYTGLIEVSRMVDRSEFHGSHLMMIPRYDTPDSEWFSMSDEEIKKRFLKALKISWPDCESAIAQSHVAREKVVQTIWINKKPLPVPEQRGRGLVWSINTDLSDENTLNNNAMIEIANRASAQFITHAVKLAHSWAKCKAGH